MSDQPNIYCPHGYLDSLCCPACSKAAELASLSAQILAKLSQPEAQPEPTPSKEALASMTAAELGFGHKAWGYTVILRTLTAHESAVRTEERARVVADLEQGQRNYDVLVIELSAIRAELCRKSNECDLYLIALRAELEAARATIKELGEWKYKLEEYKSAWRQYFIDREAELHVEQLQWFTAHLNEESDDLRAELAEIDDILADVKPDRDSDYSGSIAERARAAAGSFAELEAAHNTINTYKNTIHNISNLLNP